MRLFGPKMLLGVLEGEGSVTDLKWSGTGDDQRKGKVIGGVPSVTPSSPRS